MADNNLKERVDVVVNMLVINIDQQETAAFKKLIQQYLNQYFNKGTLVLLNTGDADMDQLAYHVVDDLSNENQQEVMEQARELLQTQLQKAGRGKKGGAMRKSNRKAKRAGNWDRWDNDWYDGEWWDWDWNDWGWDDWDNYWYNPYYSYYYYYSWYPYYWWNYNPYSWYDWYYYSPYWGYSYVGGKKAGARKNKAGKRAGYGDLFDEIAFKDIKEIHMTCNSDNMCTLNLQFQKNNNNHNNGNGYMNNENNNFLDIVEEDL